MPNVIKMPKLSDTMDEGGVARWLKSVGDEVAEGEVLVEIETDKATMEYQSPEAGHLLHIVVPAGKECSIGEPIAVLGGADEQLDLAKVLGKTEEVPEQPSVSESATPKPAKTEPMDAPQPVADTSRGARPKSSPLARKLAATHGVEVGQVAGSGTRGRVVARDIEALARTGGKSAGQRASSRQPLSKIRKTIAQRLVRAKQEIPHYYLRRSLNAEQVIAGRAVLNKRGEQKISVNDIVSFACIKALAEHPQINVAWDDGESYVQHSAVHFAVAVALPSGLVTPVVRDSDLLGLSELSARIAELVDKSQSGRLTPDDYTGGTFTISNLGMYGIEEFTAIINPPQAAILAVGAARAVPQVMAGGQVVSQQRMSLTLSCDHRLIDGAVGALFLATLAEYLENPLAMF